VKYSFFLLLFSRKRVRSEFGENVVETQVSVITFFVRSEFSRMVSSVDFGAAQGAREAQKDEAADY
jgi:hypothetical protein